MQQTTCALSGIPIKEFDSAYLFLLHFHPDREWKPFPIPLTGLFSGGDVTIEDNMLSDTIFFDIFHVLSPVYHIEDLVYPSQRNRRSPTIGKCFISHEMIHRISTSRHAGMCELSDLLHSKGRNLSSQLIASYQNILDCHYEIKFGHVLEQLEKDKDAKKKSHLKETGDITNSMSMLLFSINQSDNGIIIYRLMKAITEGDTKTLLHIIHGFVLTQYISFFMHETRSVWTPEQFIGINDYNPDINLMVLEQKKMMIENL